MFFYKDIMSLPGLKALLDLPDLQLGNFPCQAHLSTVIGTRCYNFVPDDFRQKVGCVWLRIPKYFVVGLCAKPHMRNLTTSDVYQKSRNVRRKKVEIFR